MSYYYDTETGFYYLQSRYYDPSIGRFINADAPGYLGVDGTYLSYNLFAYCGNNPVMGYDPAGTWDWGGVAVGLGIIAATALAVSTFGVSTIIGAVCASAAYATGAVTTYAAATDSVMVVDLSYSWQSENGEYDKVGGTLLIDFKNDESYFYGHVGSGKGSSSGINYSTGIVSNYDDPTDYSELFIDVSGGKNLGLDHCWDPRKDHDTSPQATSLTFGLAPSVGVSVGYDWYFSPIKLFEW